MAEGFRTFDHTGDLGLEAWASTLPALLERATVGLMAQIAEAGPGPASGRRARIEVEGEDLADTLVAWLNAALLEAEVGRAVWTGAQVEEAGPRRARGEVWGPGLDSAGLTRLREVKAVSHHAAEIEEAPDGWRCRVILDI